MTSMLFQKIFKKEAPMCSFNFVLLLFLLESFPSTEQQRNFEQALQELFPMYSTTEEPFNGACKCVPYYLCSENNTMIIGDRGFLNLRIGEMERPCTDYMDWCCRPENIVKEAISPNDTKKIGCGWRNKEGVGFRLVGDNHNETKFGEFPWMAAILEHDQIGEISEPLIRYQCGGSLIHPRAVITSAHCVSDPTKYYVRVGEWDSQTAKEIYPHQDRDVISITIHPDYDPKVLFNDIAFLVLDSPIDMTYPNVGVACLPQQGIIVPRRTRCFATGWGKNIFGKKGLYQVISKKVDLPIVERTTCERNLRQTRLGNFFQLHESFICAGGEEEGKDTCTGDGGGPLMCPFREQEDKYVQVGIVAWGVGCGNKNVPGVYTDVALFRDWINKQMSRYNLDTRTYEY